MLGDLAILHAPQVIVAGRYTAKCALTDGKHKVALCQLEGADGQLALDGG